LETPTLAQVHGRRVQPTKEFLKLLRKAMMSANFATIAPGLALADAATSARDAKTCACTSAGTKLLINVGSREGPLSTPFGVTSFGEEQTDRKTLDFRLTGASLDYFQALDEWCIQYVAEHSERLFQKKYTLEQCRENYKPCVRQQGSYTPSLRCKVNVGGSGAVRCWDVLSQRMPLPDELRNFELIPRVHISHMWQMGNRDFGLVLNVVDCMCMARSLDCPFD
jgi:hypothetical protein